MPRTKFNKEIKKVGARKRKNNHGKTWKNDFITFLDNFPEVGDMYTIKLWKKYIDYGHTFSEPQEFAMLSNR